MEKWEAYRFGDICEIVGRIGFRGYTSEDLVSEAKDGAISLSPSNIIDGQIDLTKVTYIKWDKYYESPEIMLEENDIVLSKTGTIGRTTLIDELPHPMTLNPQLVVLKNIKVNPLFLSYYLKGSVFQGLLSSIAVGSVIPTLSQKNLSNLTISLPPRWLQDRIAEILLSFDSKIKINNRINHNLEEQAQCLYKSWFVDFEPFKDCKLVDSELGLIPEGWDVQPLRSVLEYTKKSINPQKYPETIFSHYSLPAYDNSKEPEVQRGNEIMSNKFIVEDKMILFSKLNPRIKRVWFIDNIPLNSICSTEFIAYKALDRYSYPFCWCFLNSDTFYDKIMSSVNGATGSHQRFHAEETLNILFPYSKTAINSFSALISPILGTIVKNEEEIRVLKNERDYLLPFLMNGKMTVNI